MDGALFDVKHGYWHHTWGERPNDQAEAISAARLKLSEVPRMVPIFSHRYLPAGRGSYGHPVLSMHQTDIIYYGTDLFDYIRQEFGGASLDIDPNWTPPTVVPSWRDFL